MSQRLLKNKILTFYAIILTLLPPRFPPDHGNKNFNKYDMTFFHVITFYLYSRKAVKDSAQKSSLCSLIYSVTASSSSPRAIVPEMEFLDIN